MQLSSTLPAGLPGTFSGLLWVLPSRFSGFALLEHASAVLSRNSQHPPAQLDAGGPQVSQLPPAGAAEVGGEAAHLKPCVTGRSLATNTPGCSGSATV